MSVPPKAPWLLPCSKERTSQGTFASNEADAPKQVEIFEVLDQTANVKVTAWWGVDYLLMGKFDGKWMITHVLWQSPPKK